MAGDPEDQDWVRFRMPTAENLIPMRIDVEVDSDRLKDSFCWNADEPDSAVAPFAKRLVKDKGLSNKFVEPVLQSMQAQLAEFQSFLDQELPRGERVQLLKLEVRVNKTLVHDSFLWDLSNFESDPEAFAKGLCTDLGVTDPEVAPAVAFAIREQLYEILKASLSGRETRISKSSRRGRAFAGLSDGNVTALSMMKRVNNKWSVVRKRSEWELFEPSVDNLTDKEIEAFEARDDRLARSKRRQEEDNPTGRFARA